MNIFGIDVCERDTTEEQERLVGKSTSVGFQLCIYYEGDCSVLNFSLSIWCISSEHLWPFFFFFFFSFHPKQLFSYSKFITLKILRLIFLKLIWCTSVKYICNIHCMSVNTAEFPSGLWIQSRSSTAQDKYLAGMAACCSAGEDLSSVMG